MLRPQAHGLLLLAAVLTLGATACTATAGQTPTNVPIAAASAVAARAPSPGPSPSPVRTATPVRFSGPTFILIRAPDITAGGPPNVSGPGLRSRGAKTGPHAEPAPPAA